MMPHCHHGCHSSLFFLALNCAWSVFLSVSLVNHKLPGANRAQVLEPVTPVGWHTLSPGKTICAFGDRKDEGWPSEPLGYSKGHRGLGGLALWWAGSHRPHPAEGVLGTRHRGSWSLTFEHDGFTMAFPLLLSEEFVAG